LPRTQFLSGEAYVSAKSHRTLDLFPNLFIGDETAASARWSDREWVLNVADLVGGAEERRVIMARVVNRGRMSEDRETTFGTSRDTISSSATYLGEMKT